MRKLKAAVLTLALALSVGMAPVYGETAPSISLNGTTAVKVEKSGTEQYAVHIKNPGNLVIYGDFDSNYNQNISLEDYQNNVIVNDTAHWTTNDSGSMHVSIGTHLVAGDYYLKITNNSTVNTLSNNLTLKFTADSQIDLPVTISDTLLQNEDRTYTFTLKKKATVNITGTAASKHDQSIIINNAKGVQVAHDKSAQWSDNDTKLNMSNSLAAGTYSLKVHNQKTGDLDYTFSVSTGSTTTTTTKKATKKQTALNLKSVKAGKKTITAKWNKIKGVKNYEVQYKLAKAKKWTSKYTIRTNYTIKKLTSKKKYQVRVRALNDGKKPGAFSKIKTVTVK